MREMVMLFGVTDMDLRLNTEMALYPYRIQLKKVDRSQYHSTLGNILGITEPDSVDEEAYSGNEFFAPMMIFVNIPDPKLDAMLRSLRTQKAIYPYKAILTPTNVNWTPLECFHALKKEHEEIKRMQTERAQLKTS